MKYFKDKDLNNTYETAVRVVISAPVIVLPGEAFSANISLLKANGYPDFEYEGELNVCGGEGIQNLPGRVSFSKSDEANIRVENLIIENDGIYRFKIKKSTENIFPAGNSNSIWCTNDFPYKLYFGDLHVHSEYGKCGTPFMPKSPDFGYWYAKHIAGHDFCSITDHSHGTSPEDWQKSMDKVKKWTKPGEFLAILGYEGDYDGEDGGHFNIYFSGDKGEMKPFKMNDGGSLKGMFNFASKNNAIAIGHHSGRNVRGRDYSLGFFGGQDVEPCAEVISQWGSSETIMSTRPIRMVAHPGESHYYNYAIKNGYKLGALGGSDSHATTAGGFAPMIYPHMGGKRLFEYPGAITGIYAKSLARKDIFDAIKKRRCFAAANDRMFIWLSSAGEEMGAEIQTDEDSIEITVIAGNERLREVNVIRNGDEYLKYGSFGKEEGFDETGYIFRKKINNGRLKEPVSYYIRAIQKDGDIAISSPVWLEPIKNKQEES